MLSKVLILLIVDCFLINVCVSQKHYVIDPHTAEELYKNKIPFCDRLGKSLLEAQTETLPPWYYRLVLHDGELYVGGRESLLVVNVTDWNVIKNVTFDTTDSSSSLCKAKNLGTMCYNYVTIIEPLTNGNVFVCGTDALRSKCYFFNIMNDEVPYEKASYSGQDGFPRDPKQNSTWLYLDAEKYFSATGVPVDGSGNSGFVLNNLTGPGYNYTQGLSNFKSAKWLNVPQFVGKPIEYDGFVYFFFREFASEHINAGRVVYSRVARVCKDDMGGSPLTQFEGKFITYQKARLSCTSKKDSNFMYNEIQDAYYYHDQVKNEDLVYTVFTTSQPSPTSSAICVYSMTDIASVFQTSEYFGTNNAQYLWSNPSSVPDLRPGQCGLEYKSDNAFYLFLEDYPLLDEFVQSTETVVQDDVSFVKVVVEKVNSKTVMYLGTDRGTIIKAAFNVSAVEMIEEIDLNLDGQPQSPFRTFIKDNVSKCLYVSTVYNVYKLPLETCATRDTCECTRDPFCILSGTQCVEYHSIPVLPADNSNCSVMNESKIEVACSEDENRSVPKNRKLHLSFIASALPDSNLAANDINCCSDDSATITDRYQKKTVCRDKEILVVQYSPKVTKGCTNCGVTFTADGAKDVRKNITIKVDESKIESDANCIKAVQEYDKSILLYQYQLQEWKNQLIVSTNCTHNVCKEQTVCSVEPEDDTRTNCT